MILHQMSRLFYLAQKQDNTSNINQEIYSKGLEIWPQPQPQQDLNNYSVFGVAPKTCSFDECGRRFTMMRRNGGTNCQDCGNQAKKDCTHLRCRTCCKSRGFQCQTHVKSTWVPASKRRERQQHLSVLQHRQPFRRPDHGESFKRHGDNQDGAGAGAGAGSQPTIPTIGFELGQFPAEVSSASVTFRCVRVSSLDGPDEQCAYQTAVNIGGHVFKGVLYDQGPSSSSSASLYTNTTTATPIEGFSGGGHQPHQQLDFLTTATATTAATTTTSILFDPSLYSAPLHAFMAGTQFFHPQHPN